MSLYNYHGPNTVLALEWAVTDRFHCPITGPSHLGGGENFLSPIVSRSRPCLLLSGLQLSITVQSQPTLEEEKKLLFLFSKPSLPKTAPCLSTNGSFNCSVVDPCQTRRFSSSATAQIFSIAPVSPRPRTSQITRLNILSVISLLNTADAPMLRAAISCSTSPESTTAITGI